MAILKNGQISGLIGPIVGVPMKKIQILRSAPRKRSKNSWSEKQKLNWKRFGVLTEFWKQFNYTPVQKIWKIADEGGRGINLFIKTNMPAFGHDGELIDHGRLHFTAGHLPLPHRFTAVRSSVDPAKLEVSWDNDPEPGAGRTDDELMLMASMDENYSTLINTGIRRRAGSALVDLPEGMARAPEVYLSFSSMRRDMYSDDMYFEI